MPLSRLRWRRTTLLHSGARLLAEEMPLGRIKIEFLPMATAVSEDSSLNDRFFSDPILNSPYEYPGRHWELDADGQPTQRILEERRRASFITPIPKPKKRSDALV